LLAALLVLAVVAACGSDSQTPPAGANAIVFTATGQHRTHLYIISADRGGQRQLTSGQQIEGWPLWSPDGAQIAFLRFAAFGQVPGRAVNAGSSERLGLVILELEEGGEIVLDKAATSFSYAEGLGWSPDGRRIVYSALEPTAEGRKGGIFVVDSSGGAAPLHVIADESASTPAWSPDGEQITFASDAEVSDPDRREMDIFVMRPDGTNVRQLLTSEGGGIAPVWSPDGRRIAWSGHSPDGPVDGLFIAQADGGELVDLGTGRNPVWSPDGKKIALVDIDNDAGAIKSIGIVVVDVETGERQNLTNSPAYEDWPTWSPDGKRIAFVSDRDDERGEIYIMDADGSDVRRLTDNDLAEVMIAWSPR